MRTIIKLIFFFSLIFPAAWLQAQKPANTGKFANVNGIKMYYEIHGSGDPLVLIHGGGSTINTTFGRVLESFAKSHKVIAVELQAHGRTADRNSPLSFEQDADDVATLLKEIGIPKASILGFSNGGNTAMQIAIRHPELVNKLIVASSFYKRDGFDPQFWEFMKNASLKNMPQELQDDFLKVNPDPKGLQNMHDKDVQRMLSFKDWSDDDIRKLTMPTLIVNGDADVVRSEHAVQMFRLLPKGKLAIFPGGHGEYLGEITMLHKKSNTVQATMLVFEDFLNSSETPLR